MTTSARMFAGLLSERGFGAVLLACLFANLAACNSESGAPRNASEAPATTTNMDAAATRDDWVFYSPALARTMPVTAFLPPGYDGGDSRYPVVYLLHGLSGTNEEWVLYGVPERLSGMTAAGQIRPFIVVLPQGDDSYWVDHFNGPPWGLYTARDVVQAVDARYRTLTDTGHRAVGGLSMGADGAMQLTMNYPDVFGIAGAHSPVLRPYEVAPAFFGDRPFYSAHSPASLLARQPDVARRKLIWLDVGREDLWLANVEALHAQLDALDVPHQFRLFGGEHNGVYWTEHLPDYLRFYSAAFDRNEIP